MKHPITCTLCNIGRYIVPPYHRCEVHGLFCTGCSSVNGKCPLCRRLLTIDNHHQFKLNVQLPCVKSPECKNFSWPHNYDDHYTNCVNGNLIPFNTQDHLQEININSSHDQWNNELVYQGENSIMAHIHFLQAQRQAQILNNKRARRRRHRQRVRNGTAIPHSNPIFSGNTRLG